MKRISWILPAAAMSAMSGCIIVGGPTETRAYNNTGFDSVHAASGINVVLSQGPFAVNAEAPEGNLDKIIIEQNGSELKLSRKSEMTWFGGNGHYVVNVSAPGIKDISASGGADLETNGLQAETLSLSASGGGDLDLKGLKVTTLNASASGGGDIDADGACVTATITTSGGGDFNGDELDCANVTASASGGGDIDVRASMVANGDASSGGDIHFIGSPVTVNKQESSGGGVSVDAK
ncbi:MAG: head GIN domain-containing protein [Hyphomonadaceae bacterium]